MLLPKLALPLPPPELAWRKVSSAPASTALTHSKSLKERGCFLGTVVGATAEEDEATNFPSGCFPPLPREVGLGAEKDSTMAVKKAE